MASVLVPRKERGCHVSNLERSNLSNPLGQTGGKQNRYLIYRMLQALYKRQTSTEQSAEATFHRNGVGFNSADAPVLSSIANRSLPYKNITLKQAYLVGRRLKKYIGQLVEIASEKQSTAVVPYQPALTPEVLPSETTLEDDAYEFGYSGSVWFDMVNAMDVQEYEEFKQRLRYERGERAS